MVNSKALSSAFIRAAGYIIFMSAIMIGIASVALTLVFFVQLSGMGMASIVSGMGGPEIDGGRWMAAILVGALLALEFCQHFFLLYRDEVTKQETLEILADGPPSPLGDPVSVEVTNGEVHILFAPFEGTSAGEPAPEPDKAS